VLFHYQIFFLQKCDPVIILIFHGTLVHLHFGLHCLILAFELADFLFLSLDLCLLAFNLFHELDVLLVEAHNLHLQFLLFINKGCQFEGQGLDLFSFFVWNFRKKLLHFIVFLFYEK